MPSPAAARAGLDSPLQPAALFLKPFSLSEKKTLAPARDRPGGSPAAPAGAGPGHHLNSCQVFTPPTPDHVGSVWTNRKPSPRATEEPGATQRTQEPESRPGPRETQALPPSRERFMLLPGTCQALSRALESPSRQTLPHPLLRPQGQRRLNEESTIRPLKSL